MKHYYIVNKYWETGYIVSFRDGNLASVSKREEGLMSRSEAYELLSQLESNHWYNGMYRIETI